MTSRKRTSKRRTNPAVIPFGQCYSWALRQIRNDTSGHTVLVHGTVTEPFHRPLHKYPHAWVERDGKVFDWQTIEAGHGGNFMGVGFPREVFYELFKPTKMKRYNHNAALVAALRSGHHGPWHGQGSRR